MSKNTPQPDQAIWAIGFLIIVIMMILSVIGLIVLLIGGTT